MHTYTVSLLGEKSESTYSGTDDGVNSKKHFTKMLKDVGMVVKMKETRL